MCEGLEGHLSQPQKKTKAEQPENQQLTGDFWAEKLFCMIL